jgi:hypothetical protein
VTKRKSKNAGPNRRPRPGDTAYFTQEEIDLMDRVLDELAAQNRGAKVAKEGEGTAGDGDVTSTGTQPPRGDHLDLTPEDDAALDRASDKAAAIIKAEQAKSRATDRIRPSAPSRSDR